MPTIDVKSEYVREVTIENMSAGTNSEVPTAATVGAQLVNTTGNYIVRIRAVNPAGVGGVANVGYGITPDRIPSPEPLYRVRKLTSTKVEIILTPPYSKIDAAGRTEASVYYYFIGTPTAASTWIRTTNLARDKRIEVNVPNPADNATVNLKAYNGEASSANVIRSVTAGGGGKITRKNRVVFSKTRKHK